MTVQLWELFPRAGGSHKGQLLSGRAAWPALLRMGVPIPVACQPHVSMEEPSIHAQELWVGILMSGGCERVKHRNKLKVQQQDGGQINWDKVIPWNIMVKLKMSDSELLVPAR